MTLSLIKTKRSPTPFHKRLDTENYYTSDFPLELVSPSSALQQDQHYIQICGLLHSLKKKKIKIDLSKSK